MISCEGILSPSPTSGDKEKKMGKRNLNLSFTVLSNKPAKISFNSKD